MIKDGVERGFIGAGNNNLLSAKHGAGTTDCAIVSGASNAIETDGTVTVNVGQSAILTGQSNVMEIGFSSNNAILAGDGNSIDMLGVSGRSSVVVGGRSNEVVKAQSSTISGGESNSIKGTTLLPSTPSVV